MGDVYLEVGEVEDEIELDSPEDVNVCWMHGGGFFTLENTKLEKVVSAADWREGSVQIFAHAECETMKGLRTYLHNERSVDHKDLSFSDY